MSVPAGDDPDVKHQWYWGCDELPQLGSRIVMRQPRNRTCNDQCPWLTANQGTSRHLWYDHEVPGVPMPDGAFDFAPRKRAEIWRGDLRDGIVGYGSLCHVRLAGTRERPDGSWDIVGRQCSGALVMQQRELLRHVEHGTSALSLKGAARVASDMLGREVQAHEVADLDLTELLAAAHPALFDEQISSDAVAAPLSAQEIDAWRAEGAATEVEL